MSEAQSPETFEERPQRQDQEEKREESKKAEAGAPEGEETADLSSRLGAINSSIEANLDERRGLAKYITTLLKGKNEKERGIILEEFSNEEERLKKKHQRLIQEKQALEREVIKGKKLEEEKPGEEDTTMAGRFSSQRREILDRFLEIFYGELPPSRDPQKATEEILRFINEGGFFNPTDDEKKKYGGGSEFAEEALEKVVEGWKRSTVKHVIESLQGLGKLDRPKEVEK